MLEHQRLLNQDLVLKVSKSVNPAVFDINKYEGFLDALCGERDYQKTAIRIPCFICWAAIIRISLNLPKKTIITMRPCRPFTAHLRTSRSICNFPTSCHAPWIWQREPARVM